MAQLKTTEKIEELARRSAAIIRASKARSKFEVAWDDIRYCVLEIHYILESDIDMIIAKRYVGRNSHVIADINVTILSKLDFYRKISILEEIEDELKIGIPTRDLKFFNNLRNALIHNYPKGHDSFKYKGGHIYNDLKFKDVCEDALALFKKLTDIRDKIPPKAYR